MYLFLQIDPTFMAPLPCLSWLLLTGELKKDITIHWLTLSASRDEMVLRIWKKSVFYFISLFIPECLGHITIFRNHKWPSWIFSPSNWLSLTFQANWLVSDVLTPPICFKDRKVLLIWDGSLVDLISTHVTGIFFPICLKKCPLSAKGAFFLHLLSNWQHITSFLFTESSFSLGYWLMALCRNYLENMDLWSLNNSHSLEVGYYEKSSST